MRRLREIIDLYIHDERNRAFYDVDIVKKGTLENFDSFLHKLKGKICSISDITKEEVKDYCNYLKRKGKGLVTTDISASPFDHAQDELDTRRKIETVKAFMDFSLSKGFITKDKWEELTDED